MRSRRTIAMAVTAAVLAVGSVAVAAQQFEDVPEDHVFSKDIAWMAENGITRGCNPPDNTRFCPDDPVTRGQMAAFMHRFADTLGVGGASGEDGASAYEIAVENGFEGTEEEWLASLVGPQGEQGPRGEQGPQGEPGQALVAHAITPENEDYPNPHVGFLRVVDVRGGAVGLFPDPALDEPIVEVTIAEPGTYKVEGVVQFFDFTGDADTTEYGYTQTMVGDEIIGSLWTADLPDDGSNGAVASGMQIIEVTEPNTVVKVIGVIRGDDDGEGGVAGGNLIVTRLADET